MAVAQRGKQDQNITAGQPFLLWPEPDSLYAQIKTGSGIAPGIAFCPDCAPEVGSHLDVLAQPTAPTGMPTGEPYIVGGRVIGFDSPFSRYSDWYSDERGVFFRAWLRDALSLEPLDIDALMALWESDRNGRLDADRR